MRWFLLVLILCASQSFAETFLWRISKDANALFIGGTIHVLRKSDYPLPAAFDDAFKKSTKVIFETNVAESEDPAFALQMMQRLMYAEGRNLKDDLSSDVYQQLEKFSAERGLPLAMFEKMRPPLVVLTLTMMELQRLGISDVGVDKYYFQRAQAEQKPVGELETGEQQLDFISHLGEGREDDLVRYSLNDMRQVEATMQKMTLAWRNGDQAEMASLSLDEMRREFPGIYQQLLVNRNNNWLPKLESMLHDPGAELVLVGALHLVGEDGLLNLLRKRGYHIEQW